MAAKGELYDIRGEFRDPLTVTQTNPLGTLIDPTTIVLHVKDPAAAITTPVVTKDAVGQYRVRVNLNQVGTWTFKWDSTGTGQAATSDFSISVDATVF